MRITAHSRTTQINIFIGDQLIIELIRASPYAQRRKLRATHFLRQLLSISMAFASRIM